MHQTTHYHRHLLFPLGSDLIEHSHSLLDVDIAGRCEWLVARGRTTASTGTATSCRTRHRSPLGPIGAIRHDPIVTHPLVNIIDHVDGLVWNTLEYVKFACKKCKRKWINVEHLTNIPRETLVLSSSFRSLPTWTFVGHLNGENEYVVVDVVLIVERGGLLHDGHREPLDHVIRFAILYPHVIGYSDHTHTHIRFRPGGVGVCTNGTQKEGNKYKNNVDKQITMDSATRMSTHAPCTGSNGCTYLWVVWPFVVSIFLEKKQTHAELVQLLKTHWTVTNQTIAHTLFPIDNFPSTTTTIFEHNTETWTIFFQFAKPFPRTLYTTKVSCNSSKHPTNSQKLSRFSPVVQCNGNCFRPFSSYFILAKTQKAKLVKNNWENVSRKKRKSVSSDLLLQAWTFVNARTNGRARNEQTTNQANSIPLWSPIITSRHLRRISTREEEHLLDLMVRRLPKKQPYKPTCSPVEKFN